MSKKKRFKKPRRSIIGRLVKWVFILGLWAGVFVLGVMAWYARELPDITRNATFERKVSITIKAADGAIVARYGDIKGHNISVRDLPPHLIYAVMAVEDRRFYSHWGVDFTGLARAMAVNLYHGKFVQGGSTITQQLAKNLFLSQERTLKRKIQEAMLAMWLEHTLTKDEILSAYLNRVYMGSGTYGVAAATKVYFNKDVKSLTLRESATLAGLLKAPSRFSPLANPGLSKQRTDTVLQTMVDAGYISSREADELSKVPPVPAEKPAGGGSVRYYTDWIVDELQDLIGTPQEDIVVETTLNPSIQSVAENALATVIQTDGEKKGFSQGSVIAMRPTGEVVAMVGGYDYATNQFNRAVQARRQPGSSFKPIVYLTALENGWRPDNVLMDAPITEGKYRPKNFGSKYYGEVTMATALMLSLNTVSFQLIKSVGPDKVVDMARRLGISSELNPDLSLALGTNTTSPLEMTEAYGVLANGGIAIHPYGIRRVTSEKGKLYYQHRPPADTLRVVNPDALGLLTMMMQNVIDYGTGQGAKLPWPAYGKTGTSQESRDAWFIGFTPEIVTSVWIGNDDNTPTKGLTGGSYPARIWREVMMAARGKYPGVAMAANNSSGFDSLIGRLLTDGLSGQQPAAGDAYGNWAQENSTPPQPGGYRYETRPRQPVKKIPDYARYND